ncbi:MAG TPA: carboxypeptidase regulatory-like domain-containing protein [Bryobacteraceae bacterium]|nr:carboxypeptidase regulatory-like domain-containing protein [Bryobacteraceae bacterium]
MKKKRKRRSGTSLVLLLLACVLPAESAKKKPVPQTYALVAGTVFEERGYALPSAGVTLIPDPQPGNGTVKTKKLEAVSDARGEFVFRLPPSPMQYTINVAAKGYQPARKSVSVQGEERVDVTFQLQPESK